LVGALHGYQGKPDWKVEEGLAVEMMALGFPVSLLLMLGLMLVGSVLERLGTSLPASSLTEMIVTWFVVVVVGYVQWFLVVPYLIRSWRDAHSKRANTEVR
jgi:hypothetical protein